MNDRAIFCINALHRVCCDIPKSAWSLVGMTGSQPPSIWGGPSARHLACSPGDGAWKRAPITWHCHGLSHTLLSVAPAFPWSITKWITAKALKEKETWCVERIFSEGCLCCVCSEGAAEEPEVHRPTGGNTSPPKHFRKPVFADITRIVCGHGLIQKWKLVLSFFLHHHFSPPKRSFFPPIHPLLAPRVQTGPFLSHVPNQNGGISVHFLLGLFLFVPSFLPDNALIAVIPGSSTDVPNRRTSYITAIHPAGSPRPSAPHLSLVSVPHTVDWGGDGSEQNQLLKDGGRGSRNAEII